MDEQGSTIDVAFGQSSSEGSELGVGSPSTLASGSTSDAIAEGKEPSMNQYESSEEAPAASLVGSLASFALSDILSMLATTKQSGELQVVSEATDGRVWLADGELSNAQVGTATTIGQAVFELACLSEGWFYFTVGVVSSSGQPTVPVVAVLNEVRPQVDEWREIRRDVPLEAVVTLASDPPGQDVQIRSDQWRVLTAVGTSGYSVRTVLEEIGGDQIVGLRTLRDLRVAGLIEFDHGTSDQQGSDFGVPFAAPADSGPDLTSLPAPPDLTFAGVDDVEHLGSAASPSDERHESADDRQTGLAEVAVMPPPIAHDPWTTSVDTTSTSDNGVA